MLQGMKESEYHERLKRLGLWTLKERRNRADLIKVFKLSSGNTALSLESFFVVDTGRLDVLEVTQWSYVNLIVTRTSENISSFYE